MDPKVLEKAQSWASNTFFDANFRNEIESLIQEDNTDELADRFYKDLEFGTGGLRGILGAGSNRMNIYTVRSATQGLADYINEVQPGEASVAIAYDCRNFSDVFNKEAACVLAGNGIKVYIFPELRPTPMLSFAVRELKTTAGIVITASHNPAEYNGYKVYWNDGCQVTEPHDVGIVDRANAIEDISTVKVMDYDKALEEGLIEVISNELDEKYYSLVEGLSLGNKEYNKDYGVVFTPLHGTGNVPVREILKMRGFEKVTIVSEQEQPDGNFSTVKSPNPEEVSALQLAMDTASDSDQLILATDPDADRLGGMVRHNGEWVKLTGNQIGQLLLKYYLENLKQQGKLPEDGLYVTTIVTSELGRKIAAAYGVKTEEVLTGFKYIGSIIRELEEGTRKGTYIFGNEESHGYLFDTFCRDKDAVMAAMVFAEMCAELHQQGKTPLDLLDEIHQEHGYHQDSLINKVIKGVSGAEQIQKIMATLRTNPPKELAGVPVVSIRDYQEDQILDCKTGKVTGTTGLPASNVIGLYLEDGSRITARPSGTEPKIKFYFNLCGNDVKSLETTGQQYEDALNQIVASI